MYIIIFRIWTRGQSLICKNIYLKYHKIGDLFFVVEKHCIGQCLLCEQYKVKLNSDGVLTPVEF